MGMIFRLNPNIVEILNGQRKLQDQKIITKRIKTRVKFIKEKNGESYYLKSKLEILKKNISSTELLIDCLQHIDKKEGEYHKLVREAKKLGKEVNIMTSNEKVDDVFITKTALDNLNPKQLMFFVLYNSPDYFDIRLNLTTYLDELSAWLVTYGLANKEYTKYGKIISILKKKKEIKNGDFTKDYYYMELYIDDVLIKEFETHNTDIVYDYISKEYSNVKGNFIFNDTSKYIEAKTKAKMLVNSKPIIEAMKEMVAESLEDKDYLIQQYYNRLDEIYKNTNDPKIRLECLKTGGKWLGMENVTVNTNQNHIIKGLQAITTDLDVDIDEEGFAKVD